MTQLPIEVLSQPDDVTCGPTSLHAVYRYYGDDPPLQELVDAIGTVESGGTLAVHLGCHAVRRGYAATIYSYNVNLFDPTWLKPPGLPQSELAEKLAAQASVKTDSRLVEATTQYLEFLSLGGQVRYRELCPELLEEQFARRVPILTGLSATYLYRASRELPETNTPDDVRGQPVGHFVLLMGYDAEERRVRVADPYYPNPVSSERYYWVGVDRLINAILLGVVTYDANLLVIEPRSK